MKRLLLLRHARAAPIAVGGDDFGRELTPGGEDEATRIGAYIATHGLQPDIVLCSSALRTQETARLALAGWINAPRPEADIALYDATRHLLLARVRDLPDSAASALIVGHNPGIGDLASSLAGEGDRETRLKIAGKYPPAGLSVLTFDVPSWEGVGPRLGKLESYVTPQDFGGQ